MGVMEMRRYARIHLETDDHSNEDILEYDGGVHEIRLVGNNCYLVLSEKDSKRLDSEVFTLHEWEYTEISPFEAGIRDLLEDVE